MVALNDAVTDCVRERHCIINNCSYPPRNNLGQDVHTLVSFSFSTNVINEKVTTGRRRGVEYCP